MLRDPSLIPLSHQHHNGLALCVLTDQCMASDQSVANVRQLAARIVDRYDIEMSNHFQLEEELLFPQLRQLPLVSELIEQHRTITGLVDELRANPNLQAVCRFCELLRTHIRREERELFEDAQRTLSREQLDAIGLELNARAVQVCL